MRRCARRIATRRISCTDQRIRRGLGEPRPRFWGRRLVCAVAHGRHHGEGEHDERDVAMPAVPGAGLVVGQPELGLGGLERVLDGPAPPLDLARGTDRGAGRAPGGEERKLSVGQAAPDQEPARPQAGQAVVVLACFEVGELAVGPVIHALTLGARPRREPLPSGRVERLADLFGRASNLGLADPGVELMRAADPQHVALARTAQRHLDLAHAVDAVSRHPGERHAGARWLFRSSRARAAAWWRRRSLRERVRRFCGLGSSVQVFGR